MSTVEERLKKARQEDKSCTRCAARRALVVQLEKELVESGSCTHSETTKFKWEHDNGYGRQSMNDGLRCLLCGFLKYYEGSSRWIDPRECAA